MTRNGHRLALATGEPIATFEFAPRYSSVTQVRGASYTSNVTTSRHRITACVFHRSMAHAHAAELVAGSLPPHHPHHRERAE
jgi:hypothetical protein